MRKPYEIVKYPAGVLSRKAEETPYSEEYFEKQLVRFRRANQLAKGVAIAAPQLGISKRFFYYFYEGEEFIAINPVVVNEVGFEHVTAREGCLSCLNKEYSAKRANHIVWSHTTMEGKRVIQEVKGWKARIIQHELDHLDGLCLPDLFKEV